MLLDLRFETSLSFLFLKDLIIGSYIQIDNISFLLWFDTTFYQDDNVDLKFEYETLNPQSQNEFIAP